MFIGHFGVGFSAKAAAPEISLGTLFFAAQWLDLLWPTLLLLGIEHVDIRHEAVRGPPLAFIDYPVSHSLLAVLGWAVLIAAIHYAARRDRRGAAVLAIAVLTHWLLDLLVHDPDLPLMPAGPRVGLGLWNWPTAALAIEFMLFTIGARLYSRTTKPIDPTGRWGFRGLSAFLVVVHMANVFGPPPPSVTAVAWTGEAQWLLVIWAFWVDRHRRPVQAVSAPVPA